VVGRVICESVQERGGQMYVQGRGVRVGQWAQGRAWFRRGGGRFTCYVDLIL
jgi:hypothetical protein